MRVNNGIIDAPSIRVHNEPQILFDRNQRQTGMKETPAPSGDLNDASCAAARVSVPPLSEPTALN